MLKFLLIPTAFVVALVHGSGEDDIDVNFQKPINFTFDNSGFKPFDELTPKVAQVSADNGFIRPKGQASSRSTTGCGCGYSVTNPNPASGRIVGGQEVDPKHKLPYQAWVQICFSAGCFSCGGTLLNKRYVLTAMHCVEHQGQISSDVRVALGEHNIRADIEAHKAQSIRAEKVITRQDYNQGSSFNNDIAILRLAEDATFGDNIVPACLPTDPSNLYANVDAIISGWGTTSYGGSGSSVLKESVVKIVPDNDSTCTPYGRPIPSSKMCAYTADTDTCQGDSGGPLAVMEDGRFTVVGVVSYGRGCASKGYAGVYARVTNFLDWINKNIADGWCDDDSTQTTTAGPGTTTDGPETTTAGPVTTTNIPGTTPNSTYGPGCDFTCTNLGAITAESIRINGYPATCQNGMCYGEDNLDLCEIFNYPCGGNGSTTVSPSTTPQPTSLSCKKPCKLRKTLRKLRKKYKKGKLPRFLDLWLNDIPALCDLKKSRCCAIDDPSSNLCERLGL